MSHPSLIAILPLPLPKIVIYDVGAGRYGDIDVYHSLTSSHQADVLGFEPNEQECATLQANAAAHYSYWPYCLGDGSVATFYDTIHPQFSSIYEPDAEVLNQFVTIGTFSRNDPPAEVTRTREIQTYRLDDIDNLPQPDLIKLDVQGAELDILQGGQRILSQTLVVESEVEFIPLYKNQPLFGDIQLYLHHQGFFFHKMININGRTFVPVVLDPPVRAMSQGLWADAIFVKSFRRMMAYTNDELLKMSLILHDIYHSYDFVNWILLTYDERNGTQLAAVYLDALSSMPGLDTVYMDLTGG